MAAGTETEHARSVSHCVLHLFLNSKQRTKLETVKSDGIYFRSSVRPELFVCQLPSPNSCGDSVYFPAGVGKMIVCPSMNITNRHLGRVSILGMFTTTRPHGYVNTTTWLGISQFF